MKCKLSTINGWCGIFNKSCKECISPKCEFIKKAYRQGRVEAEYFGYHKREWIPVSEPPKENGDYIVSLEDAVDTYARFFNGKWFMPLFGSIAREYGEHEITAWMPLPEPYKGEESTMGQPKSKLKNPCDSLLTDDSEACKEQKSKLDCISRQKVVEAIEDADWYHVNPKGELVSGSISDEESWYKEEDIYEAIESLKPVVPPGKVVAEIKVDIEELV